MFLECLFGTRRTLKLASLLVAVSIFCGGRASATDYALVVDISGSMKWQDPSRAAVMATYLFADLIDTRYDDLVVLPFDKTFGIASAPDKNNEFPGAALTPNTCKSKPIVLSELKQKAKRAPKRRRGRRRGRRSSAKDYRAVFREEVQKAIGAYDGKRTFFTPCIKAALKKLKGLPPKAQRPGSVAKKVVIVLTDGDSEDPTGDLKGLSDIASGLSSSGDEEVWFIAFGGGVDINAPYFQAFTNHSPPRGEPKHVATPDLLPQTLAEIFATFSDKIVDGPHPLPAVGRSGTTGVVTSAGSVEEITTVVWAVDSATRRKKKHLTKKTVELWSGRTAQKISGGDYLWSNALLLSKAPKKSTYTDPKTKLKRLIDPQRGISYNVKQLAGPKDPFQVVNKHSPLRHRTVTTTAFFIKKAEYGISLDFPPSVAPGAATTPTPVPARTAPTGGPPPARIVAINPTNVPAGQRLCLLATITDKLKTPVTNPKMLKGLKVHLSIFYRDVASGEEKCALGTRERDCDNTTPFEFVDDGTQGDVTAGDGVFTGCWQTDAKYLDKIEKDKKSGGVRMQASVTLSKEDPSTRKLSRVEETSPNDRKAFTVLPEYKLEPKPKGSLLFKAVGTREECQEIELLAPPEGNTKLPKTPGLRKLKVYLEYGDTPHPKCELELERQRIERSNTAGGTAGVIPGTARWGFPPCSELKGSTLTFTGTDLKAGITASGRAPTALSLKRSKGTFLEPAARLAVPDKEKLKRLRDGDDAPVTYIHPMAEHDKPGDNRFRSFEVCVKPGPRPSSTKDFREGGRSGPANLRLKIIPVGPDYSPFFSDTSIPIRIWLKGPTFWEKYGGVILVSTTLVVLFGLFLIGRSRPRLPSRLAYAVWEDPAADPENQEYRRVPARNQVDIPGVPPLLRLEATKLGVTTTALPGVSVLDPTSVDEARGELVGEVRLLAGCTYQLRDRDGHTYYVCLKTLTGFVDEES